MSTTNRMIPATLSGEQGVLVRFAAEALATVKSAVRTFRNRKAMNQINDLDDYQLLDIGLKRSDVEKAAGAAGILEDPFDFLPLANRARLDR